MRNHSVVGIGRLPCSTTDLVGDIRDDKLLIDSAGLVMLLPAEVAQACHDDVGGK